MHTRMSTEDAGLLQVHKYTKISTTVHDWESFMHATCSCARRRRTTHLSPGKWSSQYVASERKRWGNQQHAACP